MTRELIRSANLPTLRGEAVKLPDRFAEPEAIDRWASRVNDPDALLAIDLFCGAGGMSLGFENAGFVVAAGIDADPVACQTHAANFLSKTRNTHDDNSFVLMMLDNKFLNYSESHRVNMIISQPGLCVKPNTRAVALPKANTGSQAQYNMRDMA